MSVMVFTIFSCLFVKKSKVKFLLASLKPLTNSKSCSESRITFLFRLSFALLSVQGTCIAGFRNNFQNHRRVSEQLLKAQDILALNFLVGSSPFATPFALLWVSRKIKILIRKFVPWCSTNIYRNSSYRTWPKAIPISLKNQDEERKRK
jgi:hypothetical protein